MRASPAVSRQTPVAYSGDRSCVSPFEGVKTIDEVIDRLKSQVHYFERMREAGMSKVDFDGEKLFVFTADPQAAAKCGLKEDPYVEFDDKGELVPIQEWYVDEEGNRMEPVDYYGDLPGDNPYEDVDSLSELTKRLKDGLATCRSLKRARVCAWSDGGELALLTTNPNVAKEYDCRCPDDVLNAEHCEQP